MINHTRRDYLILLKHTYRVVDDLIQRMTMLVITPLTMYFGLSMRISISHWIPAFLDWQIWFPSFYTIFP